jgi:hypothetical protein
MSFEEKRLIAGRSPLHSSTTFFCNLDTWLDNLSKIKRSADGKVWAHKFQGWLKEVWPRWGNETVNKMREEIEDPI